MNLTKDHFAAKLKQLRNEFKLSQSDMANKLNINRPRYASYEEGRAMPDIPLFLDLCKCLNVNPYWFASPLDDNEKLIDINSNLTPAEEAERQNLLQLQADHNRWFSQEEFNRLQVLNNRLFQNQT